MNPDTIVAACCYAGDAHQVIHALGLYLHHKCPFLVFSPVNSQAGVNYPGVIQHFVGRAAYIGQESIDRQRNHLEILSKYPCDYFLLNDSDSFCLSPNIPEHLYNYSSDTIWSNEVVEPRPHESPYPKLAFQPPYFLSKRVVKKMLTVAHKVTAHAITPYIDWWMLAVACEAGLQHRSFSELEHAPRTEIPCMTDDPWLKLEFKIRYRGAKFMHPIKLQTDREMCIAAHEYYASQR